MITTMRTHLDIIADAGGPTKMGARIQVEAGLVHAWKRENSIPAAYWARVVDAEISNLDELAAAAEARKFPDLAAQRAQVPSEGAAA